MKSLQNDGEQKDSREKLHTLEWAQQHKPPTHRKPKKAYTMEIANAQLWHKTATITQTFKPAVHQTYRICTWFKHISMRKQKTHLHPVKKTLKDKCKHQIKEENTKTENTKENRTNVWIQGKETTRENDTTQ